MFVVYKDGKTLLETESYAHACKQARIDAYRNPESQYSIWDKEKRSKAGKEFLPLYRIALGSVYRTAYMPVGEVD